MGARTTTGTSETTLHERIIQTIKRIPKGKVATYGQIAMLAGNPRAARQVVRALHSSSGSHRLPWHRVINARGQVALQPGEGFEEQRARLRDEGVISSEAGKVDLARFQWQPR